MISIDLVILSELRDTSEGVMTPEGRLAAEQKFNTERNARINTELDFAVNEGRIKDAQRSEWASKLAGNFDTESATLRKLKPALNTKSRTEGLGQRKGEAVADGGNVAAINEAVNKRMKESGMTYHAAYLAVREDKDHAGLFVTAGTKDDE